MACARGGYVGLVRVEQNRLNIAAALAPSLVRMCGGLGNAAMRVVAEAKLPQLALAEQAWKGTPLLTRNSPIVAARRLFLLGDAAGYVEPFTGEGMSWAIAAARSVAPLAHRGSSQWSSELALQWQRTYRLVVSQRQ